MGWGLGGAPMQPLTTLQVGSQIQPGGGGGMGVGVMGVGVIVG